MAELGSPRRRPRRPRAVAEVVGGMAFVIVLGATGWRNPWHLTYLDLAFTWPFLAGVFLAGVGVLWHLYVRRWQTRVAGFVGLLLCAAGVGGLAVVVSGLDDPSFHQRTANADNDVEVSLASQHNVWDVWLRADRGLLSREHLVARIGMGDSAPPPVEAHFTAADRLVVTADGRNIYRLRYDPGSLDVEDETCRAFRGPIDAPGCTS